MITFTKTFQYQLAITQPRSNMLDWFIWNCLDSLQSTFSALWSCRFDNRWESSRIFVGIRNSATNRRRHKKILPKFAISIELEMYTRRTTDLISVNLFILDRLYTN